MHTQLVLTVLGDDRPGLVKAISTTLEQHQGNWTESRVVELAGKFAGLLKVAIPASRVDAFLFSMKSLESEGLKIIAEQVNDKQSQEDEVEMMQVEVLGPDAPGIVKNITTQLAKLKVNVEEMMSEQRQAAMSGEKLFFANLHLALPNGVSGEQVQDALEALEDQLLVDFNFG